MDARPSLDAIFDAFGVPGVVTRPNSDPIETTVVWLSPTQDLQPIEARFQRREPIKVLALRKDEVPTVPKGTRIVAPELAEGADAGWIVDGFEQGDSEHHRAIVIADPTYVP